MVEISVTDCRVVGTCLAFWQNCELRGALVLPARHPKGDPVAYGSRGARVAEFARASDRTEKEARAHDRKRLAREELARYEIAGPSPENTNDGHPLGFAGPETGGPHRGL